MSKLLKVEVAAGQLEKACQLASRKETPVIVEPTGRRAFSSAVPMTVSQERAPLLRTVLYAPLPPVVKAFCVRMIVSAAADPAASRSARQEVRIMVCLLGLQCRGNLRSVKRRNEEPPSGHGRCGLLPREIATVQLWNTRVVSRESRSGAARRAHFRSDL